MVDEKESKVEVADAPEVEVLLPEEESQDLTLNDHDLMDAVIEVGAKIEAYAKAMDAILNVIIKRSYEGDWVCHSKKDATDDEKKANLGAAAAERIAQFLGIQEKNWTHGVKEWSDDKTHYTWIYEADFGFKNRWVHAVGKAGTRDKFFGKAKGQMKPLSEIQEDHIKTAAFRGCRKEGVRTLFGLRSIPLSKLEKLGYDISKIAYAGFEDKGKELSSDAAKAGVDGLTWRMIQIEKMTEVKGFSKGKDGKPDPSKPWTRWDIFDVEGVKFGLFGTGKRVAKLQEEMEKKTPSEFGFQVKISGDKGQFKNYEIVKIKGVEE